MATRKPPKKDRKMAGMLTARLAPTQFDQPYSEIVYTTQNKNPKSKGRWGVIMYHGRATRRSDKIAFGKFLRSHKLKLNRAGMVVHSDGRKLNTRENEKVSKLVSQWEVKYPSKNQRIVEGTKR